MRMIGTIWSILEVFFYRLKFCDDFLNIYVEGEGGMLSHFISHIVNNFFPYWYFKNNSLPLSSLLKKFFNAQIYLPKLFRFLKRTCQFSGENSVCILQYLYFKHIENFKHIYKSRWNKKKKLLSTQFHNCQSYFIHTLIHYPWLSFHYFEENLTEHFIHKHLLQYAIGEHKI